MTVDKPDFEQLLLHWLSLSTAQRKGLKALAHEVDTASHLMETSVNTLSERFIELADIAQKQAEKFTDFANDARHIELDGTQHTTSDVFRHLDDALTQSLSKITQVAQNADDLQLSLSAAENILHQEIQNEDGKHSLKAALRELEKARRVLNEIELFDINKKRQLQTRFQGVFDVLITRSQEIEDVLGRAEQDSKYIVQNITDIVVRMQFQDRTSQRLSLIGSTMIAMADMLRQVEDETPSLNQDEQQDQRWLLQLIDGLHLGEMRERFVKHALLDADDGVGDNQPAGGDLKADYSDPCDDIELF